MKRRIVSTLLAAVSFVAAADAADKTVKVFILAGQSNMVGHGKIEEGRNPAYKEGSKDVPREIKGGVGCLRTLATDPKTKSTYGKFLGSDGKWVEREDVFVYATADDTKKPCRLSALSNGHWFGPELGFGFAVGDYLKEPVLLIKTSWGGKDLAVDFRPPSSGSTELGQGRRETGAYYKKIMELVKEGLANYEKDFPELKGYKAEIAGFGWHQGWNDGCSDEATAEYEKNMCNFINDVRKDLAAKDMPFVIANTGQNGMNTKGRFADLCEAQLNVGNPAKHPEFKDTVTSIDTRPFVMPDERNPSTQGYHWSHSAESHYLVGNSMGEAIVALLKKQK
jgi:alpha-galactosidase